MKRISVSFYDEIYKIIEAIAKEERASVNGSLHQRVS